MQNKKALFFVNSLSGGGAERVCLNLSEELNLLGYQCDYITLYKNDDDYEVPAYINVFSAEIPRNSNKIKKLFLLLKSVPKVNRYLKNRKYSLITAHLPMSHIFASMVNVKKKVLYVMHNAQWPLNPNNSAFYRMRITYFYKNKKVITVSEGIRQELVKEYGLKNVTTIYNPISLQKFQNVKPVTRERPYVISVGRLAFPKRPDLALDLYHEGKYYHKFDLVFLGQGDKLDELKKRAKELKIDQYVFFEGFKKNPYEWISGAELMLSISDSEAMPMNIVEALCCKTKVIAADCKYGPNEILTGEYSAFLINPSENMQESIKKIDAAFEQYPEITERVVKPFDSRKIIVQYLEVWKKEFKDCEKH